MAALIRFYHDEHGGNALEYGLLLSLLTIGIIGTTIAMGGSVRNYLESALAGFM